MGLTASIEPTIMAPVDPALAESVDCALGQMAEPDRDARIGLCSGKPLAGWSPHLDHLGGRHDVEPLGRALLGSQHRLDFLFVAEQHDTAVRPDASSAMTAPLTAASGAKSPPMASIPIFNILRAIWFFITAPSGMRAEGRAYL